jgi:hypothetical protein
MINNFPVLPFAGASLTVNTGTTPDEVGNVITARYGCRVIGVVLNIDNDYAVDVVLYYGASTYTVSLVANERANVTNGQLEVYFTQAIDIKKGDSYRIAVKPTTSSSITAYDYTFPTSFESIAKSKYFADEIITKTSRSDAGGWTDDATKFVSALPIITGYNYGIIKPHGFNGF